MSRVGYGEEDGNAEPVTFVVGEAIDALGLAAQAWRGGSGQAESGRAEGSPPPANRQRTEIDGNPVTPNA